MKHKKITIALILIFFFLIISTILVVFVVVVKNRLVYFSNVNIEEHLNIFEINTAQSSYQAGDIFDLEIFFNTQNKELGAFAFDLDLRTEDITIDIQRGNNGIIKGGNADNFILMSNPKDLLAAHFRFSGICAQDCASGVSQHVVTIHLEALKDLEVEKIATNLRLRESVDVLGEPL